MIYKYPESFARFYDTIYHPVRDSSDSEYFSNECRNAAGKVLEAGVGTGRLFMSSLKNGVDIYGLDISEAMLEILYSKLPGEQHFRISQQNIIDFKYDFKFDLIIAPFRVIMHLLEKQEQLNALKNICDHLNDGGRFIFDVFIPDLKQLINGINNAVDFEGEYSPGKKMKRIVSTLPDLSTQVINISFLLEWEEDGGARFDKWDVPMRFFFRYELEHLIERSGFGKNYRIYGDYAGNDLNRDSKEFVVVCTKK